MARLAGQVEVRRPVPARRAAAPGEPPLVRVPLPPGPAFVLRESGALPRRRHGLGGAGRRSRVPRAPPRPPPGPGGTRWPKWVLALAAHALQGYHRSPWPGGGEAARDDGGLDLHGRLPRLRRRPPDRLAGVVLPPSRRR